MGTASSQVFLSTIIATSLSTITGITAAKFLAKMKRFALPISPQEID
jgi:spore maturation protein A